MGMFDNLICEMPLPDAAADIVDWQTKSLECAMNWYAIRRDGRLVDRKIRRELKPGAPPEPQVETFEDLLSAEHIAWSRDWWESKEGPDEPVNYTGEVRFYTSRLENKEWVEFCAFVKNGRCVDIVQIVPEQAA